MHFRTEVIANDCQYEGVFSTLAEAVEHIQCHVDDNVSEALINGTAFKLRGGYVYGNDDQPLCTNPEWYKTFASGNLLKLWNEAVAKAVGLI